jgi:hypothetical protein
MGTQRIKRERKKKREEEKAKKIRRKHRTMATRTRDYL